MKNLKFLIPIALGLMAMSCNDYDVSPLNGGEDDDEPVIIGGGGQSSNDDQDGTVEIDSLGNG